jgi:hypothetical protein
MLRNLTLFLIATIPALVTAQATTTLQPKQSSPQHSITNWPDPLYGASYGGHIDIVTFASPGVRQRCHVRELTADSISCRAVHHQPPIVFQRSDILALLFPSWLADHFSALVAVPLLIVLLVLALAVL